MGRRGGGVDHPPWVSLQGQRRYYGICLNVAAGITANVSESDLRCPPYSNRLRRRKPGGVRTRTLRHEGGVTAEARILRRRRQRGRAQVREAGRLDHLPILGRGSRRAAQTAAPTQSPASTPTGAPASRNQWDSFLEEEQLPRPPDIRSGCIIMDRTGVELRDRHVVVRHDHRAVTLAQVGVETTGLRRWSPSGCVNAPADMVRRPFPASAIPAPAASAPPPGTHIRADRRFRARLDQPLDLVVEVLEQLVARLGPPPQVT